MPWHNTEVYLIELFWDLSWYPESRLPSLIQSTSGAGYGKACTCFYRAASPMEELQEVLVARALVAGDSQLYGSRWVAAPQLAELLPDLPVKKSIKKWVYSKGGICQPGDRLLQVIGNLGWCVQCQADVEGKVRQPAEQKLANNDHQSESGFTPTERPVAHYPPWGIAGCDDGRLAVDWVRAMLQLTVRPQGQRSMLAGSHTGHLVHITVHSKNHHSRQAETDDAKEQREDFSVVTVTPMQRAACSIDGAQAAVVWLPSKHGGQPQHGRGHPHHR